MHSCNLDNILAIYNYFEAYELHEDGTNKDVILAGPPPAYTVHFQEFYCLEHDCSFKQFRSVLNHIGESDMVV